jgi:FkbM family methyltransferase
VILDLGANVGYTMVDFALRHPTARVIGVELDRDNAVLASRNVAPFGGRCTVLHSAVWTANGTVRYGMGVPPEGEWGYRVGGGAEEAPAVRVETLLDRLGVGRVAFLKMDIEGAELELFSDGAAWLSRVDALYVEVHSSHRTPSEALAPVLERAGLRTRPHPAQAKGLSASR